MPFPKRKVEDLGDACYEYLRRKGCTEWAGFLMNTEADMERAAEWLAHQYLGVEEIAMESIIENTIERKRSERGG